MAKKVFVEGQNPNSRAYFGWQDEGLALFGLKEGYKNCADKLVKVALTQGKKGYINVLDTYIFPILFLYRHSLEISLKQIYFRFYHEMPQGGHNLLVLWDKVEEVINTLKSDEFLTEVKQYKKQFIQYSFKGINMDELRNLFIEMHEIDKKADAWRYLIDRKGKLYFSESKFIDYKNMKKVIGDIYMKLDYIYSVTDEYLSGDPM